MKKYYGTVKITLNGFFKADGKEEILDDPLNCISDCAVETEIIDIKEVGEPDGDEEDNWEEEDDWEEDDDWEE